MPRRHSAYPVNEEMNEKISLSALRRGGQELEESTDGWPWKRWRQGTARYARPVWDSSRNSLFCVAYVARNGPCGVRLLSVYQTPRRWPKGRQISCHKNNTHCCSVAQSCLTLCDPTDCSTPGFPVHHLLECAQTHVHWIDDAIQPSHPLLPLLLLPSIFLSVRVFSKESALPIMWPKCWSFNFSISPFNEYAGLISCRIDWFDLFAVQGTLKNLL